MIESNKTSDQAIRSCRPLQADCNKLKIFMNAVQQWKHANIPGHYGLFLFGVSGQVSKVFQSNAAIVWELIRG